MLCMQDRKIAAWDRRGRLGIELGAAMKHEQRPVIDEDSQFASPRADAHGVGTARSGITRYWGAAKGVPSVYALCDCNMCLGVPSSRARQ